MLSLTASEPVPGYAITLIEGARNTLSGAGGETFACPGAACDIPLQEGENAFTFWALSSWGDSSRLGSLTARVDTQPPHISGEMSGTPGEAGWYVSPVTFSASAADPQPGSGIETLAYALNGGAWQPYTAPVSVGDGAHVIAFRAQDLAGHVTEISQSVQVDTLPPQLSVSLSGDQRNGWYLSHVTFAAQGSDSGSGLARIEYALDGGAWQPYVAPVSVGDGVHTLRVRAFDAAGNAAAAAPLTFQVDGTPPRIHLPESWYIWESVTLRVSDGQSGLADVEIEIRDGQGRWQKVSRAYEVDGDAFSTDITWDRRFGDGTLAPIGTYQVIVKAFDQAGNMSRETANIHIPAPNAPTYTPAPTRTALPTLTPAFSPTPDTSHLTPETLPPTRTPIVAAFGAFPTPRPENPSGIPQSTNPQSTVLWGAAAAAAIGAATVYALEQRRKRKEEEARQAAEAHAEAARRNAAEEMRKVQSWLQGNAMLEAALKQSGLSQEEQTALRAQARAKGLGIGLGLLGAAVAAAQAERQARQAARSDRAAERADYAASGEAELDSAARSYMAWAKAVEESRFDTQAYAKAAEHVHKPAEPAKSWWQRGWEWFKSPATWWGFATEEESVELMQKAKGFPDISIPLPMIKGFGMDEVTGPIKYTLKTDTTVRLLGRVLDDFSPGVLTGIGLGITVTPNLVKNIREKNPWHQTAADLMIDTGGFVVSELAGWGAGALAGFITGGNPIAILTAKIAVDGFVSVKWDEWAEVNRWNEWLGQRLEEGAQSFGQKVTTSMQEAMDTEKYPPVPTPPTEPQMTRTPVPVGQNPVTLPSETPTPQPNTSAPPTPSTP